MENIYYTPMSEQRAELRKKWSGSGLDWDQYLLNAELFHKIKTEIIQICEAFNLGDYVDIIVVSDKVNGFKSTQFTTSKGLYTHYYKIE